MPDLGPLELAVYTTSMTAQQQMMFMQQYSSAKKDRTMALVLSLLAGGLGIDRFYLGDIGLGVGKLLTIGGLGLWTIIDWFLIMGRADQVNRQIAQDTAMISVFMNQAEGIPRSSMAPPTHAAPPGHAPNAPRPLVVTSGGREIARLNLVPGASFSIGRSPGANIPLQDQRASSSHAAVDVLPDGGVAIRDLGSTNGTFISGVRVSGAARINPGATARFGDSQVVFTW